MTDDFENNVAVDGAVGDEGERGSSAFSMAHGTPLGRFETHEFACGDPNAIALLGVEKLVGM